MGRPQKTNVYKANATALGDMAGPLRTAAGKVLDSAGRVHEQIFGFDWQGHTKDAVDERANREYMQDRAVAVAYDKLADAYEHGAKAMQPMIESLKSKAQGLEGDHFAVSEDWAVTDTYDYAAARTLAKLMDPDDTAGLQSQVDQLQAQRANEAATETSNLQRLADQLGAADEETAKAINAAKHLLDDTTNPNGPQVVLVDDTLPPGAVRNVGPVAGTGADPGIPGIKAADLGEIVKLPDGRLVAVFGDAFSDHVPRPREPPDPSNKHYPSVAVEAHIDPQTGRLTFGKVLSGPDGSGHQLFPIPDNVKRDHPEATFTLPAGTITANGKTYMKVAATDGHLQPTGGSWLVEVNSHPENGWTAVGDNHDGRPPPSYQEWKSHATPTAAEPWKRTGDAGNPPSQISGYQGSDGHVHIAADSFDRSQPVTMYQVDNPADVADPSKWRPLLPNGTYGSEGQLAAMAVSDPNDYFGELSFREIDGRPVLSGLNLGGDGVEVRVGAAGHPEDIFSSNPIVVGGFAPGPAQVACPYSGFVVPDADGNMPHLDKMGILVSQWTPEGAYNTQEVWANVTPQQ